MQLHQRQCQTARQAFTGSCRISKLRSQNPAHYAMFRSSKLGCNAASSINQTDTLQKAKTEIARLAGSKHGTDKPPEEKAAIANIASSLSELETLKTLDMTGSKWKLIFTESTASSSGKVGPFVGKVIQEFPADKPGQYINWLYLGPATISLLADYKQTNPETIVVSFQYVQVELGIWKWKKDLKNQGTWDGVFIDDDYRVFRANKKNIFVLEKLKN